MGRYSIEPRTKIYVKRYGFLSFARQYKMLLLDTGLDVVKTASKKVTHKAGEFLGNKNAVLTKPNNDKNVKQEPVEEIIIPPEKSDEIMNKLRKVLRKWSTIKYVSY